jgi:hypothetical protein
MSHIEIRIPKNGGPLIIEGKEFEGQDHSALMREMSSRIGDIIEQTPDHEHIDCDHALEHA